MQGQKYQESGFHLYVSVSLVDLLSLLKTRVEYQTDIDLAEGFEYDKLCFPL